MKSRASITASATLAFGSLALAETPAPPTPVIQVGVDVIRLDATVTDESGRAVTDLRPEDFRLKVDGKPVPVENAAFFGGMAAGDGALPDVADDAARARPAERSIVFVIDDLNLGQGSAHWARRALKKLASRLHSEEAMIGVRFTSDESDKVRLSRNPARFDAAIEGFRYNPRSVREFDHSHFQQRIYSLVTTINALRSAPGRKAVILMTDGFSVEPRPDSRRQLWIDSPFDSLFADRNTDAALRMIVEIASRASTVVYTMYPSGTLTPWPSASGGAEAPLGPEVVASLAAREVRQELDQLASATGGLALVNRNSLERGLLRIVEDQRSYYLIGFEPPRSTFSRSSRRPRFHKIKLTVDRPGVRVRTRSGFYGVTDDDVLKRAPLSASTTPAPLSMP
jgi:VWFA-related protein